MKTKFYWFLFCNNALLVFRMNRQSPELTVPSPFDLFREGGSEGFDFWKDLDNKWSLHLLS